VEVRAPALDERPLLGGGDVRRLEWIGASASDEELVEVAISRTRS